MSGCRKITKVAFSAAFPQIMASLQAAIGTAWIFLASGEMVGAQSEPGFLIMDCKNAIRSDALLAVMIVIGIIGLILNKAVAAIEKRVQAHWGGRRGMIEIEKVSKGFPEQKQNARFTALDRVSSSVAPGELFCLLGPSGCGESTLLGILVGFIAPDTGEVRIDGEPVTGPSPSRVMIFQHYGLLLWRTVAANAASASRSGACRARSARPRRRIISSWWALAGPKTNIRRSLPGACSSGWLLPGRWPSSRRSCLWTGPSARWTPSPGCGCTKT